MPCATGPTVDNTCKLHHKPENQLSQASLLDETSALSNERRLFTTYLEILPGQPLAEEEGASASDTRDGADVEPLVSPAVEMASQTVDEPGQQRLQKEEWERRERRIFELNLRKAKLNWPHERIRQAEEIAGDYKTKWFDLGPRIEKAIGTVVGHQLINR